MPNSTEFPATSPSQNPAPIPEETACRTCGVLGLHILKPGTPPHAFGLYCQDCHKLIRWVSTKPKAEREASREHHRQAALAAKPPTDPQLRYLDYLGFSGSVSSFLSASEMITSLVYGRVNP